MIELVLAFLFGGLIMIAFIFIIEEFLIYLANREEEKWNK